MHHNRHYFKLFIISLMSLILFLSLGMVTSYASSNVNNYIYRHHLKPARINYQIYRRLPRIPYRHGVGRPEGVVVHETANPNSNIYGEINFMKHDYNNAFVHSFVDNHHIINIANTKYQAWGVGHPGNARFVQFEQIEVHNKRAFAKEVNNAAYYTSHLLKSYKLKPRDAAYTGRGTVWSHASVAKHLGGSDHTDPIEYYRRSGLRWFGQPYSMHQFYQLAMHYYDNKFNRKHHNYVNHTNHKAKKYNHKIHIMRHHKVHHNKKYKRIIK